MLLPDASFVEDLVKSASALTALAPVRERLQRLAKDYARGLLAEQRALVVALVGSTGAGKSTLLNALTGRSIAIEGENRPTTATAVVYAPEDAQVGALAAQGGRIERYAVTHEGAWSGQVFIDTPDFNSIAAEHADRARAVLENADVALVVMHKGSVAEDVQASFLTEFARRRRLLFVLNAADLLAPDTRRTLEAQTRRLASERFGMRSEDVEVFAVSALEQKSGHDPTGEWPAFTRALAKLGERSTADRVRRSNALGALRELQSLVGPALERTEAMHRKIAEELDAGLLSIRETLDADFRARLEASAGHLTHEVRQEAASRFWGPAAWGMRLSLVGTSGMGAATLLARVNPLLAGGVALGSAVVNRVQQAASARAAERRVLSAGATEAVLEQAARAAVVSSRAAAGAQGLSADQLTLPDTESLVAALQSLRESAWIHTTTVATAEAVRRWWQVARWLLLPLCNLPLLALFAHVAYRVVRGYLEGTYVGVDFLLNAIALGGLLLFAGSGLASLTLLGVRRRVIVSGRQRFRESLAASSQGWVRAAQEAEAPARAAAGQLLSLAPDGPAQSR